MITSRCKRIQTHCEGIDRPLGVEVGVEVGNFSEELLKNVPRLNLTGVDPYLPFNVPEVRQVMRAEDCDGVYSVAITKYGDHPYSKLLRLPSVKASWLFGNEYFDFVYIDALHTYEACLEDIQTWWPKLKMGGLFGVHDFSGNFPGVQKAVGEFFQGYHIEETGELRNDIEPSAFIIKQ